MRPNWATFCRLGQVECVIGAESQAQTGEPHAPDEAQPLNQQAISLLFRDFASSGRKSRHRKARRLRFLAELSGRFLARRAIWVGSRRIPSRWKCASAVLFPVAGRDAWEALWDYRQILATRQFRGRVSRRFRWSTGRKLIIGWARLSAFPIREATQHLRRRAKQLSLSFLYWMQTEAPRHDGGAVIPNSNCVAMLSAPKTVWPNIPTSAKAAALPREFTVCEQHVASGFAARWRGEIRRFGGHWLLSH